MLKIWWDQRIPRERMMITIGSIITTILLIDVLIWQPLNNAITQMQQSVMQNTALLVWMQDAKVKLHQWQSAGYTATSQDSSGLLTTVEQTLATTGLSRHLTNTSEQSATTIDLSFSSISFDSLMDWQQSLWVNHNIVVSKASIKKDSTDGLVDATITLTRR